MRYLRRNEIRVTSFLLSAVVLAMVPSQPVFGALPLIAPDPNPQIRVPKGYTAYLLRQWDRYVVIRAQAVEVRDDDLHRSDELLFVYGTGDGPRVARRPKYAGELSHVLLPVSFTLPEAVKALTASPPPTTVPENAGTAAHVPWLFEPEPVPMSAPPGAHAYRAVIKGLVITGTVTGIDGTQAMGFVFSPGSKVRIRKFRPGDDPTSHIVLPVGCTLPSEFLKSDA